jgi:hypothetical protein
MNSFEGRAFHLLRLLENQDKCCVLFGLDGTLIDRAGAASMRV